MTRDQLGRDQLTKLNLGFPNDRSVANDQQQPNEQLHLRVMELSARLLLSSFVVIIFSNIMIIRLGEVTLERDQLAREKEKGREGRWESQCQRWNIISFREAIAIKKSQNCGLFPYGGGGLNPIP